MAARVFLHIGVQKSGTTYLQQMLQDRRNELKAINVLYSLPEGRRKLTRVNYHERATFGILGTEYPWVTPDVAASEEHWARNLQGAVHEWPGTAIVSAEALSVVRADAARRIIDAFGGPDKVHVVITGRSLGKLIPSKWQQHMRNGKRRHFDSFLRQLARERQREWAEIEEDSGLEKWRALALGRLAKRWATFVGEDQVTFIANPGSPADLLWHRFLRAAGLDEADLSAPGPSTVVHSSITAAEAEILRASNGVLSKAGWHTADIRNLNLEMIAAMRDREDRGPRLGIRPGYRDQVERWNEQNISELRDSGIRVLGDLAELRYSPDGEPPEPTMAQAAAAAGAAVLGVANRQTATGVSNESGN